MSNDTTTYVGQELELFAEAENWKSYFRSQLEPFFGRNVLEVGAGIGATTNALCGRTHDRWVCLEPDPSLSSAIQQKIESANLPPFCEARVGTLGDSHDGELFDTVMYIDVLEHIEDDRAEALHAVNHLKPGGHLVILSPAFSFLFSPFDDAVGHYRRYTKRTLRDALPAGLRCIRLQYLDCGGFLLSLANRLMLRSSLPTKGQIEFWDSRVVPVSRWLDPLIGHGIGRSVIGVWQKADGGLVNAAMG